MNNYSSFNPEFDSIEEVFQNIDSKEKLDDFLEQNQNQNEYCKFILEKRALPVSTEDRREVHHIIPLHANGPEFDSWNLLILSFEDHSHAHYLLSKEYDSKIDNYVCLWRSGLTDEARSSQREYAQTKSVFKDPNMQSKFGQRGGSTWTEKKTQAVVERQSIYTQKAFENGMIWYYQPNNIFIRVPPKKIKLITTHLVPFFKQIVPSLISDDKGEVSKFSKSLKNVITGIKRNTYNGLFLIGIVNPPFTNRNFKLHNFYQSTSNLNLNAPYKNKFETNQQMRQSIGKAIGKRSSSYELIENLKFTSVWYYEAKNLTVEIKPCEGVKELVEQLQTHIDVTYTDKEKKMFSALIKNKMFGKTRKGWTLKELKDDSE